MRYRRLSYRYSMVVRFGHTWPFGEPWQSERARLVAQARWRPDADLCETPSAFEIAVDLAGVDEEDFEVQLYDDVLVVEGRRQLPLCPREGRYHAVAIRQGPFRLELPLPAPVVPEGVEARHDRGVLHVTLPKRKEG
jgi:HSP20 family protein